RPVILGCVYSDENRPPWNEYVEHQKVGIRSQSRPGTGGYSEISMDDRREDERVTIHAQRDLDVTVLHDTHVLVHADAYVRTSGGTAIEVDGDAATTVKGAQHIRVEGAQVAEVRGSQSVDVRDGSTRSVGANETVAIGGSATSTIGGASRIQIQSDLVETVGGDRVSTTGRRHVLTVGTVGSDTAESDTYVWGNSRFGAQDTITIESAKEIILRCGDSQIRLTPDSVEVKGKAVSAAGSQHVELGGNGPSLHLGDDMQVTSKTMTLQSSGARMILGDSAALQSQSVQLGKPSELQQPTDPNTPQTSPALSLVVLAADSTPLANRHYQVQVGSTTAEGTTDGSGTISVASLPPDATTGRCTVWTTDDFPEGPRVVLDLAFGHLEPSSSILGAQKRLRNLGFLQGNPSESVDLPCLDAILIFQEAFGLDATGELDAATLAKLAEIHP
ncbi:MAG: bacteriophage T4 gp5 trimerization domain-containing protein, partial [Polyangiaceae bacterium]